MPAGAVVYAETSGLADLIRRARHSELYTTIVASQSTQDFLASDESKDLRNGIKWAQTIMRMNLWDAGEKLLGGRAAFGFYPNPENPGEGIEKVPDALVLIHPADPKAWSKQRIWTDPLLAVGAKRIAKGEVPWGVKVYETKPENGKGAKTYIALNRKWVMISSNPQLLKRGVKLVKATPEGESMADNDPHLAELAERLPGEHLARAFIDTKLLSEAAGGRLGVPEKSDNPMASLLFGGMLELAAHSDLACFALDFEEHEFAFHASLDANPADLDPKYQVFFAGAEPTRPIPQIPGLIGGITLHRDLATWYQSRDDLLQAQVLPGFDKFETGLGNILPGKDIGEDVIPLIGDNFTLLTALQDYDYLDGELGVKLPGFALVFDLAEPDPQAGADMFQLFFQTFLSILNLQAAEQNRQPWLIAAQDHNGTQITYARYFEKPSGEQLPTVFNFLPAAARVGDQYVMTSSLGMCKDLVDALKSPTQQESTWNSHGRLDFAQLAKALDMNRQQLIASRLNEGRDTEQAAEDIKHLFLALEQIVSISGATTANADGFELKIKGTLK